MQPRDGWPCPWESGRLVDDFEACKLRRLSAAEALDSEKRGVGRMSPMLRVCIGCESGVKATAIATASTQKTQRLEERTPLKSINNRTGPFHPGVCINPDCAQERNVFKKTGLCQPCTMRGVKPGKPKAANEETAEGPSEPAAKPPTPPIAAPPAANTEKKPLPIMDLALVPGLAKAIEEQARENLRSPEMQALWILREAVKRK